MMRPQVQALKTIDGETVVSAFYSVKPVVPGTPHRVHDRTAARAIVAGGMTDVLGCARAVLPQSVSTRRRFETIGQVARLLHLGQFVTRGLIWRHAKCKTTIERFYHMLSNNKREPLLRTLNDIHDRLGYFVTTILERVDPESAAFLRSAMGSIEHVVDRLSSRESARSSSA
jgi:hypothetical protein